jgi:hypothetical protein
MDPRLLIFKSDFKVQTVKTNIFTSKIIAAAKTESLKYLFQELKNNSDFFSLTKENLNSNPNFDQFLNNLYFNKLITNNNLDLANFIQKDNHFREELRSNFIEDLLNPNDQPFFLRPLFYLSGDSSLVFKNYLRDYFLSHKDLDELYSTWYLEASKVNQVRPISAPSQTALFQGTIEVFAEEIANKTVDLAFLDVLKVLDPGPGQIGFDRDSFRTLLKSFKNEVYDYSVRFMNNYSNNNFKESFTYINDQFLAKAYLKGLQAGVRRTVFMFVFNVIDDALDNEEIIKLGRDKSTTKESFSQFQFLIDRVDDPDLSEQFNILLTQLEHLEDYKLRLTIDHFSDHLAEIIVSQENILKGSLLLKPAKILVSNLNYALFEGRV